MGYHFQTTGVVRSDRGFATAGLRGFVYTRTSSGHLNGWVAVGQTMWKDLNCVYLQ